MNGAGLLTLRKQFEFRYSLRAGSRWVRSSGGISSYYSMPSSQTNINMTVPMGTTAYRNVQDVAMTADDIFIIADRGLFYPGVGGTSCAAPLWAGFAALVIQLATNGALLDRFHHSGAF